MTLLAKFISAEPSLAYRKPISRLLFLRTVSIAIQLLSVIVLHFSMGTNDYIGVLLLITKMVMTTNFLKMHARETIFWL